MTSSETNYFKAVLLAICWIAPHAIASATSPEGSELEVSAGLAATNVSAMPLTLVMSATLSNFQKSGDLVRANVSVNGLRQAVSASYTVPMSTALFDTFSVRADYLHDVITQDAAQRQGYRVYGVSVSNCGQRDRLAYCMGIAAQNTQFDVNFGAGYMADYVSAVGSASGSTLSLRSNARYDTTDERGTKWFPVGGVSALNAEVSMPPSQFKYALATVQHTQFFDWGQRTRLKLRGDMGTLSGLGQPTPPHLRFFGGFGDAVRGYAYRSLSPVDSVGQLMGANHKAIGSVEVMNNPFSLGDVPVVISAFHDAGQFSGTSTPGSGSTAWVRSSGIGLGLPVKSGQVSLSLAKAQSRSYAQQPLQIQVRMNW